MVALRSDQAAAYLASPPKNVRLFLLYGNDPGAISERARLIERTALQRGGGETALRFGSDQLSSDPGCIATEAFSASLFGGEPVISLRVLDGRHNVLGAVEPLLARPPDAAWLIVEAGELAATSPLRKAFEASPHAAAAPAFQLDESELASLIRSEAAAAGVVIEPAAVEMLIASLARDRLASRRELEKLFLYAEGGGPITAADVQAIVGNTLEFRSDAAIDAALLGDHQALEAALDRLRADGESAAALAAQALRHLIQLQALRAAVEAGSSLSSALQRARPPVHSRRRAAIEAEVRRWPSERLRGARSRMAAAILLTRRQAGLETASISAALHDLALESRRLRRNG